MWSDIKYSFTWLTGMKKLIFYVNNFFGSGHFFDPSLMKKDQKKAGTKKIFLSKNHWHHACQPCIGIFEVAIIFSHFSARASDCSGSNLVSHWCLKMKSRGLYHTYRLWKSRLLLDFQQVDPLYCKCSFDLLMKYGH